MLPDAEIKAFVERPRSGQWFTRHYVDLHNACFKVMLHGVRYDSVTAKVKYDGFIARKDEIKLALLPLTGGFKLWSETIHRSDELVALYETQRALKAGYDTIPKEDRAARKAFKPQLVKLAEEIANCKLAGRHQRIEVGSGLSDDKIIQYLYGPPPVGLGIKAYTKRRDGGKVTPTVDDIALKKVRQKRSDLSPLIALLHEHRKCNTLLKYVDENKVDSDGRIRCQYKPAATQNARLSSSENPLGTGTNLQNFDRTLKELLQPDEG